MTVIALFFIGWTQTPLIASKSTVLIPITIGIDGLFIATYACLVKHSFLLAILCSMLVWFVLSLGLVIIQFHNFPISLVSWVILSFVSYLVMEYILKVRSISRTELHIFLLKRGIEGDHQWLNHNALSRFGQTWRTVSRRCFFFISSSHSFYYDYYLFFPRKRIHTKCFKNTDDQCLDKCNSLCSCCTISLSPIGTHRRDSQFVSSLPCE